FAPGVRRVAVSRYDRRRDWHVCCHPDSGAGIGGCCVRSEWIISAKSSAWSQRSRVSRADRDRGGLSIIHRDPIIALAARHRLPAVYGLRPFITACGLLSSNILAPVE